MLLGSVWAILLLTDLSSIPKLTCDMRINTQSYVIDFGFSMESFSVAKIPIENDEYDIALEKYKCENVDKYPDGILDDAC